MASRLALLLVFLCSLTAASARLRVFNLRATNLPSDLFGTTDGYVKVSCGSMSLGETSVRRDNANPWWNEEFASFEAQEYDVLRLEVHDHDLFFDDLLGACQRQIVKGTHDHDCYLEEGMLHYTYTLD